MIKENIFIIFLQIKWEAETEWAVLKYAATNKKIMYLVVKHIGNDALNRPMYYIGGFSVGGVLKIANVPWKAAIPASAFIFKATKTGAATNYIHTEINPLH